jgi:hypothetical protein
MSHDVQKRQKNAVRRKEEDRDVTVFYIFTVLASSGVCWPSFRELAKVMARHHGEFYTSNESSLE